MHVWLEDAVMQKNVSRERAIEEWRGGATARSQESNYLRQENVRLRRRLANADVLVARYEVLSHECDHRIKNSLQIVASLMLLQARQEKSQTAREALQAAALRVHSIADIHEALLPGAGEDSVDLGALLKTMCVSIHRMAGGPLSVSVVVSAGEIQAPVSLAQPVVLAVNELVINSLRHAFPDGRRGTVRVEAVEADGCLRITVKDVGVGLPPSYGQSQGYGTRLIRMMVQKIGGALEIDSSVGCKFTLIAPMVAVDTSTFGVSPA
jgi:two-component sensor histidine kinase